MTSDDSGSAPIIFLHAAPPLLEAGWLPHPVPRGRKGPPQTGVTGFDATTDLKEWGHLLHGEWLQDPETRSSSTAVRLPQNVVGLDVDEYGAKRGDKHLSAFQEAHDLPDLPKTYRVSARGAGSPSGVRLYRLTDEQVEHLDTDSSAQGAVQDQGLPHRQGKLPSQVCPDVEMIHSGHRYIMNPGSGHPDTHGVYELIGKSGKVKRDQDLSAIDPAALPALPQPWFDAIVRAKGAQGSGAGSKPMADAPRSDGDRQEATSALQDYLEEHAECGLHSSGATLSPGLTQAVRRFAEYQNNATVASALIPLLTTLLEDTRRAHKTGEVESTPFPHLVISQARAMYVRQGDHQNRPAEFDRAVAWAFPVAMQNLILNDSSALTSWASRTLEDDFWERTTILASCRDFARSRIVAPQAMLGCALALVSSWLPPHLVLPPIVGGEVGLSFFVAVCAESGGGKSAAMAAAQEWLEVVPHKDADLDADKPVRATTATGEGLAAALTGTERVKIGGVFRQVPHQHHRSVRFDVDEIETLGVSMGREGASIRSFLKSMWMGKAPTTLAATAERTRILHDHEFRVAITAGVQPEHAAVILSDSGGGFPQRWLWAQAHDPHPLTDDELDKIEELGGLEPYVWNVPCAAYPLPSPHDADDDGKPSGKAPGSSAPDSLFSAPSSNTAADSAATGRGLDVIESTGPHIRLDVTQSIKTQVRAAQRSARPIGEGGEYDGEGVNTAALDGHALLMKEKTAAMLAALHGHIGITPEFESMADWLMAQSDATRTLVLNARNRRDEIVQTQKAKRQGKASYIAREAEAQAAVEDFEGKVMDALQEAGGEVPFRELSRNLHLNRRGTVEEQLDELAALPMVEVTETVSPRTKRKLRMVSISAGEGGDDE